MKKKFGFPKEERLSGYKDIRLLFRDGKTLSVYPFLLIYREPEGERKIPVRMGMSVSRRKFGRAVDRNRIKRLMREAYRLEKSVLGGLPPGKKYDAMLIYLPRKEKPLTELREKMRELIHRWQRELTGADSPV